MPSLKASVSVLVKHFLTSESNKPMLQRFFRQVVNECQALDADYPPRRQGGITVPGMTIVKKRDLNAAYMEGVTFLVPKQGVKRWASNR